jgi:hypothetical protein
MRHVLPLALSVVALVCLSTQAQGQRRPGRGENPAAHGWLSNLSTGKSQAARDGKPLMVVLRCVP